jgi:collagen type I/II/III/V/XI/XXIV/XXVII alpha
LRQAIANLGTGGGTINFASTTADVELISPLQISSNVTIFGGIASGLQPTVTITQAGVGDVLTVLAGADVTLEGVEITGGNQTGGPPFQFGLPGIPGTDGTFPSQDQSDLGIQNAGPGGNGGTGGLAPATFGGGIVNSGALTIIDSIVTDNSVVGSDGNLGGDGGMGGQGARGANGGGGGGSGGVGGAGGDGGKGGVAEGGGIYNTGTLDLITSTVTGNVVTGGTGGPGGDGAQGGQGGDGGPGDLIPLGGINNYEETPGGPGGTSGSGGNAGNGGPGGNGLGAGVYNTGVVLLEQSTIGGNVGRSGAGGQPGTPGKFGYNAVPSGKTLVNGQFIQLYDMVPSVGGNGSPDGAPGNFGIDGDDGTIGLRGSLGGDLDGGSLVMSTGALEIETFLGETTPLAGLSISDSAPDVDVLINAGSGLLYVAGDIADAAPFLKFQGTASAVNADLAKVGYEGVSNGFDTVTFSALDGVQSGRETINVAVVCFAAGTCIATPGGDVPVEQLAVGDSVLTLSGKARPITWIGTGQVKTTRGQRNAATPVIVGKGAIADNVPSRDLHVTKGHSLYIDGVLIPVEFLVNHRSIIWDDHAQEITIYHVELDMHDILLANGAPAESYRDDGNRWLFQNGNTGWTGTAQAPCAPVLTGGPVVDAVWRRLLDRSGPRPGVVVTGDPDLHLVVDAVRLDAASRSDAVYVFRLPARRFSVRVISRAGVQSELGLARDPRPLGVALQSVVLMQGSRHRVFDAVEPAFFDGFHAFEPDCGIRWTDGDANLPPGLLDTFHGPVELMLTLGGTTQYPVFAEPSGRIASKAL